MHNVLFIPSTQEATSLPKETAHSHSYKTLSDVSQVTATQIQTTKYEEANLEKREQARECYGKGDI